ncbi:MAG: PilZ domain-containing protein [Planctomycetes bacterium]|nr:PilZ domain-containing protein [Planctomycetota bacterium]
MNEVVMMDGSQTQQILQTAIDQRISAIMSYLSKGKWHVAKVLVAALDAATLSVQTTHSHNKQRPININIDQPVGISFKYEYGKFVFDATVIGLEPATDADAGGTVVLTMPEQIEVIQRRSYFRVEVPDSLKVNVTLWHRKCGREGAEEMVPPQVSETGGPKGPPPRGRGAWRGDGGRYCRGKLVDISAGGAQIVLDSDSSSAPQFNKGQFIGMRFTPLPYERPLVLNAQIRNALPRADGESIYLGLQIVGLEASPEGRRVLSRLVGVVERYYRMNRSGTKKNDRARPGAGARASTTA